MTMEMSESYASFHNRKALKNEVVGVHEDVAIFKQMAEDYDRAGNDALEELAGKHPDVLDLLHKINSDDASRKDYELFRSYKEAGGGELPRLINASFLPGLFAMLKDDITNYVSAVHKSEGYKFANQGLKEEDTIDQIINLDQARTFAHDALIKQLQAITRAAKGAGIDTSWQSVIQLSEGEHTIDMRKRIQQWAERVADYLAKVSKKERSNA